MLESREHGEGAGGGYTLQGLRATPGCSLHPEGREETLKGSQTRAPNPRALSLMRQESLGLAEDLRTPRCLCPFPRCHLFSWHRG